MAAVDSPSGKARPDDWRRRPWKERLRRAWPCLASAALLHLAFPPFNLGLLVFVALVPWLVSLRESSGCEAWRSGYVFGFLFGTIELLWMGQLVYHWVGSLILAGFLWMLACAIFALYFGWLGVLIRHAWHRKWPWAIPVIWAGIEVVRAYIPGFAFPWGILASPLWPYTPLIQHAHYGTMFLVSAWVALINVTIGLALVGSGYSAIRTYLATALAVGCFSILSLSAVDSSKLVPMTVGQPGVDLAFSDPNTAVIDLERNITAMANQAAIDGSKLLVLPEGVADAPTMPPTLPFHIPPGLPVLFGARRGIKPTYQSAIAFDGRRWQYVDKTRLVIFGEFVPGRDLFPFIAQTFRLPTGDLDAGQEGVKPVDLAGIHIGPIICFEALFPDIAYRQGLNDVRLLAVIGVDDWFMDGNAPQQLRAMSVWRAVETGLPLVRSTPLGYTMVCDGKGRVLAEAPLRELRALRVEVPIPDANPLFRATPVFPVGACVFALVMPWLRPRRKKAPAA